MLQNQRCENTGKNANQQTHCKHEKENPDTLEETSNRWILVVLELVRRLKHDDSNGVVQDTLSKDDSVELRIDFVCFEDGQDSNRVCSRKCRAEGKRLDKRQGEGFERKKRPKPDDDRKSPRRDKSSKKGECQY